MSKNNHTVPEAWDWYTILEKHHQRAFEIAKSLDLSSLDLAALMAEALAHVEE